MLLKYYVIKQQLYVCIHCSTNVEYKDRNKSLISLALLICI